ncbi:gamma-butyrobetaine hydroxylase-like domain-containing protein [Pseudochelatococcus sp. G4_1912]|uniref:gamma-butyrobetaine hydroxylase-like domain-containing protein n=1 Tax=Pseudochelatococcus sp. G4_1912 TaxID=3114288 RepID=UPI0039C749D5
MANHWPEELRLSRDKTMLTVTFPDIVFQLPAEYLRVSSPSAEVRGHGPGQAITVSGKRNVAILAIEPVGRYAVKLIFDDLHASGIYTWNYLHELGQDQKTRWESYIAEITNKNLSRDPPACG